MPRVVDRQQGFFDAVWYVDLLPADSIYGFEVLPHVQLVAVRA